MVETSKRDHMSYFIFLCENRILAQNIDGHIIDLEEFTEEKGTINWLLDGNSAKGGSTGDRNRSAGGYRPQYRLPFP